jgi:peptide subunit release factor RF-3
LAKDADGRITILFQQEWDCQYFSDHHPKVKLSRQPPGAGATVPL